MKETMWSKLRELWAIRERCKEIKLEQRQRGRNRRRPSLRQWNLADQTAGGS